MTATRRSPGTDRFEDRLLHQLYAELPDHPAAAPGGAHHRRRRWLLGTGGLVATAAAVVAAFAVTSTNPAYAIRAEPDGSFAVVLYSTAPADLARAEDELQRRGARIELVPATLDCLGVLDAPLLPSPPHALPSGPPTAENYPEFYAFRPVTGAADARRNPITGKPLRSWEQAFIVEPDVIPTDRVLWVAVAGADSTATTLVLVAQFAPVDAGQPDFCLPG